MMMRRIRTKPPTMTTPHSSPPPEPWLTLQEAAALLRVSTATMHRRLHDGTLPGRRIGRRWLFLRSEIEAAMRRSDGGV